MNPDGARPMIAVDWGTSRVRAWRLDGAGRMSDTPRTLAADLLSCRGRFEALLAELIAGWNEPTVLLAGMVGSRNGWHEVAYRPCPAGAAEIADGLCEVACATLPGRRVFIAPGLMQQRADAPPEVMRGEETQLVGLMHTLAPDAVHTVCLPGTHSKWARLEGGRVVGFRSAMTGELYALLRRHSLLAGLMPPLTEGGDADDGAAFDAGVAASARDGGLTNHLFGVRTLGLFGSLAGEHAPSYLSGLLIGHELRALRGAAAPVHLVGASALCGRYARALQALGTASQVHDEALAARGLQRLAQAHRLLD